MLKRRLDAGEAFDVAVLTAANSAQLTEDGTIIEGTRVDIARSGIGVATSADKNKPDISSAELFRSALINAKAIGYVDPAMGGASGVYMRALIERLGIAEQMKPKTKLVQYPKEVLQAVARGEVDLGMTQINFILPFAGTWLVGPLPRELQRYTVFSAGILTKSKVPAASKALINFLTAPATAPVLRAKGFDPA